MILLTSLNYWVYYNIFRLVNRNFQDMQDIRAIILSKVDQLAMMVWPRLKLNEKREIKGVISSLRK